MYLQKHEEGDKILGMEARNAVLVHGAVADASGWGKVKPELVIKAAKS